MLTSRGRDESDRGARGYLSEWIVAAAGCRFVMGAFVAGEAGFVRRAIWDLVSFVIADARRVAGGRSVMGLGIDFGRWSEALVLDADLGRSDLRCLDLGCLNWVWSSDSEVEIL